MTEALDPGRGGGEQGGGTGGEGPPPSADTAPPPPTSFLGLPFLRFWTGNMFSNLADGAMLIALPLIAALLTDDPMVVAGLTVVRFLPWLIFGLVIGALVDRLDRGLLMIYANLVRSAVLVVFAVLVATENATIMALYVVMFVVMFCEIFYDVSAQAMVPGLVPKGSLDRANARLVGGRTIADDFAGTPLAGLLFVVAAALPVAVNAGAYLLGALVLLGLPLSARRPRQEAGQPVSQDGTGLVRSIFRDIADGARFVYADRAMRAVVLLSAATTTAIMGQAAVLVLLVREHFGVPDSLYGVFFTGAAVGGIVGVLLIKPMLGRFGRFPTIMAALSLMAISCIGLGLAPNALVACLAWASVALAGTLCSTVTMGCAQLIVPTGIRGRVMSCVRVVSQGAAPLGALAAGLLSRTDLRLPSLVAGGVILFVCLLVAPSVRVVVARADDSEREGV